MDNLEDSSGSSPPSINRSLTFSIPYFGGISRAAFSDQWRRADYLCRTVHNISLLTRQLKRKTDVYIHVVTEDDFSLVSSLFGHCAEVIVHSVEPVFLAASSLRFMQSQPNESSDFIYHTEADQIIQPNIESHLSRINDSTYLVPHRLEEIPATKTRALSNMEIIEYDGRRYIVCNRAINCDDTKTTNGKYYIPSDRVLAFGGAFLSTFGCLRRTEFLFSERDPVEHASGFDMFSSNTCIKTVNVIEFFVIHLSGYEFNLKRNPLLI